MNGLSRASRNDLFGVWETEQTLREQGQHMMVCVEWVYFNTPSRVAPQVYDTCPSRNARTGFFVCKINCKRTSLPDIRRKYDIRQDS